MEDEVTCADREGINNAQFSDGDQADDDALEGSN